MERLHTYYSNVVRYLKWIRNQYNNSDVSVGEQRGHIQNFARLPKATLDEHCETRPYTLNFHLVNHMDNYRKRFYAWNSQIQHNLRSLTCTGSCHTGTNLSGKARVWLKMLVLWTAEAKKHEKD